MCEAAENGQLEDVKKHLEDGVDVNWRNWVSVMMYHLFLDCHFGGTAYAPSGCYDFDNILFLVVQWGHRIA